MAFGDAWRNAFSNRQSDPTSDFWGDVWSGRPGATGALAGSSPFQDPTAPQNADKVAQASSQTRPSVQSSQFGTGPATGNILPSTQVGEALDFAGLSGFVSPPGTPLSFDQGVVPSNQLNAPRPGFGAPLGSSPTEPFTSPVTRYTGPGGEGDFFGQDVANIAQPVPEPVPEPPAEVQDPSYTLDDLQQIFGGNLFSPIQNVQAPAFDVQTQSSGGDIESILRNLLGEMGFNDPAPGFQGNITPQMWNDFNLNAAGGGAFTGFAGSVPNSPFSFASANFDPTLASYLGNRPV